MVNGRRRTRRAWTNRHSAIAVLSLPRRCFSHGPGISVLMENAVRYGRRGGHLAITAAPREGAYTLILSMMGPAWRGIVYRKCLNVLTREGGVRARHSGGSGRGLSIARAICVAHGGRISARYRRAAVCRFALFCRTLPPQKKTACLIIP